VGVTILKVVLQLRPLDVSHCACSYSVPGDICEIRVGNNGAGACFLRISSGFP
jgi:hypothetical protein